MDEPRAVFCRVRWRELPGLQISQRIAGGDEAAGSPHLEETDHGLVAQLVRARA